MIERARSSVLLALLLASALALGPFSDAAVGQPAAAREIAPQGKQFLRRTVRSALLVAVASREAGADALGSGHADVFGSNVDNVQAVAAAVAGSTIVPGPFLSVPMAVGLPKGRSAEAQARLTDLVNEAKTTGIVTKAIEAAQLKGVRVAGGSRP